MLRKEFLFKTLELPSYQITYAKKGANFKWKIVQNTPKMMRAIWNEKYQIYDIDGYDKRIILTR
jgi:hypothetical protein